MELLARGLSVREIEDAFRDETGRLLLSKTAVSEIGERLWADYQEFATRDLGEYEIAYLFVDGIADAFAPGTSSTRCWPPGILRHLAAKCFCI
ncbi:transposase [Mesorhizobium sp. M0859]